MEVRRVQTEAIQQPTASFFIRQWVKKAARTMQEAATAQTKGSHGDSFS